VSYPLVLPDSIAGRAHAIAPPFACFWTRGGLNAAWVQVTGELDMATSPQLAKTLGEPRAQLIVLDLRELDFMDSSGVHAIVNASVHARQVGRRLVLLRSPPYIHRIFGLTGSSDEVENGYMDQVEAVEALLLDPEDESSSL
jgi:anti-sigma B factor antagonist